MIGTGLTLDQYRLIHRVNNNHLEEYLVWCAKNKDELMKWFDENISADDGVTSACHRFIYYLAATFMERRINS